MTPVQVHPEAALVEVRRLAGPLDLYEVIYTMKDSFAGQIIRGRGHSIPEAIRMASSLVADVEAARLTDP